jgi:hypothetical protein
MAKNLPEIFEDMRQALLGNKPGHKWGSSAGDAVNATIGGLKGFGGDTLTSTADKFNQIMPYIERAGFDVIEIEVGLGLSPKVVAHLVLRELLDDEAQADLLQELKGKKLTQTIISSLFKTSEARKKLNFKRFHYTHIELELSILPTIVLKFRRNDSNGDGNIDADEELITSEIIEDGSLLPEA